MKTKYRKDYLWLMVLAFGVFASGCVSQTSVRQHPEFADVARRIKTVAILPPEVEHQRVVFSGDNERLTERELSIARELTGRLRTQLEGKHYAVQGVGVEWPGEPRKGETTELQRLRTACDEALKQLYAQGGSAADKGLGRVSVGPVANPVADQMQADALLVVRYAGYEKSGGQQAKDLTSGILLGTLIGVATGGAVIPISTPAKSGGAVQLVLIDGTTGDVLWANGAQGATDNRATGRGWSRRTQSGMHMLIQSAIDSLPEKVQNADSSSDGAPADKAAQ